MAYLRFAEIQKELALSKDTLKQLCDLGLPFVRLPGGHRRWNLKKCEKWMEKHLQGNTSAKRTKAIVEELLS